MIGKIIGNYQITKELAHGGMGTVYYGHHLHLPREVVVKSILFKAFSKSAQQHLKARFRREACIQSQLDHANVVRVYEFFVLEDDYYIVMEYVPGMSLKDYIAQPGLPSMMQAVHLCKQALAALNYAHNFSYVESDTYHTGIIHRDIKPANLLINDKGRLKITDFGIVKVAGDDSLTQSGFQPGTVEYMSPEQLLGLDVDERSDLYSLGVTFYEMLTGRLPFPRSATGSDWEVRKGHIELEPPSILNLRSDLHPDLARIIMRALQKNPNDRFQSAAEFLEHLREFERQVRSDGAHQQVGADWRTRSLVAASTLNYQLPVVPVVPVAPVASSVPGAAMTLRSQSSTREMLEQSITVPITPADELTRPTKSRFALIPRSRAVNTTRLNRETFISVPVAPPKGRWPLSAAAAGVLVLSTMIGAYLFAGRQKNSQALSSAATRIEISVTSPAPAPTAQLNSGSVNALPIVDNSALHEGRASDRQERYAEAIRQYEEYLRRNPEADDTKEVLQTLATLKRVRALIATAGVAMQKGEFATAQQSYQEALKLRPQSELAKTGLATTKSKLLADKFKQINPPTFPKIEELQDLSSSRTIPPITWRKMRKSSSTQ